MFLKNIKMSRTILISGSMFWQNEYNPSLKSFVNSLNSADNIIVVSSKISSTLIMYLKNRKIGFTFYPIRDQYYYVYKWNSKENRFNIEQYPFFHIYCPKFLKIYVINRTRPDFIYSVYHEGIEPDYWVLGLANAKHSTGIKLLTNMPGKKYITNYRIEEDPNDVFIHPELWLGSNFNPNYIKGYYQL